MTSTLHSRLDQMTELERSSLRKKLRPRTNRFIPVDPSARQTIFLLLNDTLEVMYGGAAGGGKMLRMDAKVLTPFGWKANSDLKEGDTLVNPRTGGSMKVIKAWDPDVRQVWRVHFNDGTFTDCSEDHLWAVKLAGKRNKAHNRERSMGYDDPWLGGYKVIDTKTLKKRADQWKDQKKRGVRSNAPMVPVARETQFTVTSKNVDSQRPIDPYLLGLVLGDGRVGKSGVTVTSADSEVEEFLDLYIPTIGGRVRRERKYANRIIETDLLTHFRSLGLYGCRSWEKFIPSGYLLSPLEVRQRLMQGLMDTDGYVDSRGHLSYTTTSKQLSEDVVWLARSLGAFAKVTTKTPTYDLAGEKVEGRLAYTVWIKPHNPELFVSLTRKLNRVITQQNQPVRKVVDVEILDEEAEMRCITVDTIDGLYLTDDFVVTHNSEAGLMGAAQFVDVPGYAALILRRSYRDLALPGALMDRSHKWWKQTDAHWDGTNHVWTFPSGAKIQFGYLEHEGDETRYQSAEFQYIFFDELTQFSAQQYTYMFSRLRRTRGMEEIPLRMRAASNPGGVGHIWVKKRWNLPSGKTGTKNRVFVPAKLEDNPHLDQETYEMSFEELSPVTKAQLRHGDWSAHNLGGKFDPAWFSVVGRKEVPDGKFQTKKVRHWDLAATEPTETEPNPDWTAGCLLMKANKMPDRVHNRIVESIRAGAQIDLPSPPFWYVMDVVRARTHSGGVEELLRSTAARDGSNVDISIEQERGSSGKLLIENYRHNTLPGYRVHKLWTTGDKETRAKFVSDQASSGRYFIVEGDWNSAFLDELSLFKTKDVHDDQVDAVSGAHIQIDKLLAMDGVNQERAGQY